VEIYLPWTFVDEGTYKVSLDNIPATTATVDNNNDNAFYGAATTTVSQSLDGRHGRSCPKLWISELNGHDQRSFTGIGMGRRGGATDADIAAVSDDQATATIPHVMYPGCGIPASGTGGQIVFTGVVPLS
jgi:hypothetical protein